MAISDASLERLSALISNADEDALSALWDQCEADFLAICNQAEVPPGAATIVEQMVAFRYSQMNAEGLGSQSYSGASETYLTDYPDRLKRAMYRYRRMQTV